MNKLSAGSLVEVQGKARTSQTSQSVLLLSAWLGTLLLSRLPQIVLVELGVIAPADWSLWWWIVIGAALFILTYVWGPVRPLRGYFLILTLLYVVPIGLSLLKEASFWISWFGSQRSWPVTFFGERLDVVLMALAMAGLLALLGHRPRDYFLVPGNVSAQAEGLRLPWTVAGPVISLLLIALSAAAVLSMVTLSSTMLAGIIPLLPAIFLFALMNAFGEELAYRAAPLSQLWEIVGKRQAIWMTALWFGLGHYYGGISFGAAGAVYITLTAVIFGKAMLETKGLVMPVLMHLVIDMVIYTALAMGSA